MSNPVTPEQIAAAVSQISDAAAPALVPLSKALLRSSALRVALRAAGWYASTLDRASVFSKDTLLHALYQSGEYPAHFGFNWDALADALNDLEWLGDAQGVAMFWRNPDVLKSRAPETYATFVEIVEEAHASRAEQGYAPLRVLIPA
jgi:hypothetical protein